MQKGGARARCDIAHRSSNGRMARRRGIPVARAGPRPGWPAGRPALDTRLLTIALALVAARRRAIGMATKGSPAPSANGAAKHDRVLGSPHGRLTGPKSGPRRGYRVPHARAMTGVGAPYTPRTAVLIPVWGTCPAGACRSTAASPSTPLQHPSRGAPLYETSTRVHAIHPSRHSPCLRPPGRNGPPLELPPEASAPRRPGVDDAR